MKSYTDKEQSKKLAEILPLESADMAWCNNSIKGVNYVDEFSANLYTVKEMQNVFDNVLHGWDKYWTLIPCWSLAALLKCIGKIKPQVYTPILFLSEGKWILQFVEYGHGNVCEVSCNNSVDTCYEMILTLHEQNLL